MDPNKTLRHACITGDLPLLQSLSELPLNLSMPFWWTCHHGHLSTAQWIYNHYPIDLTLIAFEGYSVLEEVCFQGHLSLVQWLYPLCKTSCIHHALYGRRSAIVQWLLENGHPHDIEYDRNTSLHIACKMNSLPCVQLLCQHRAPLENVNREGETPFLSACLLGHLPICRYLYLQGTNPHAITICRENAILLACKSGNLALVQWLHSIHVNLHNHDMCGQSALFYAQGHTSLIHWLCQHLPVDQKSNHGMTPLLHACRDGHLASALCLYHHHASISIKDKFHHSALYYAIRGNHIPIVKWLCSFGVPCDEYLLSTTNAECLELLFLHGGLNYNTPFIDTFKRTFKWRREIRSRLKKHYFQRFLCLSQRILDIDDLLNHLPLCEDLFRTIGDYVGILRDSPWKQILSVK